MDHLDQYECHPEIKSLEHYGHYLFEQEGRTLPVELTGYFDYEAYGRIHMKASERLTDGKEAESGSGAAWDSGISGVFGI